MKAEHFCENKQTIRCYNSDCSDSENFCLWDIFFQSITADSQN